MIINKAAVAIPHTNSQKYWRARACDRSQRILNAPKCRLAGIIMRRRRLPAADAVAQSVAATIRWVFG